MVTIGQTFQQIGNDDCRVFVMANMRTCAGIHPQKVLRPQDVQYARHQFCLDIIHGQLDFPNPPSKPSSAILSQTPLAPYSTPLCGVDTGRDLDIVSSSSHTTPTPFVDSTVCLSLDDVLKRSAYSDSNDKSSETHVYNRYR
jgi:hypothetical protein